MNYISILELTNFNPIKQNNMKFLEIKAINGENVLLNPKHIISIKKGIQKSFKASEQDKNIVKISSIGAMVETTHTYETYEEVKRKLILTQ